MQEQILAVEKERDAVSAQDPPAERKRRMLTGLSGIGAGSAAILARKVFVRLFASRRHSLRKLKALQIPVSLKWDPVNEAADIHTGRDGNQLSMCPIVLREISQSVGSPSTRQ